MNQKMGLLTKTCATIAFTGMITCSAFADAPITDFKTTREFQGTATALITCNLLSGFNDDWRGMITHTAYPGDIFHGPTKNKDGKTLDKGTVLFTIDKVGRQILVDQFVAQLAVAKDNYERDKQLIKNNAVSRQQLQEDESAYFAAKAQVDQQIYLLNLCEIRAPFDGIVNSINNVGWLSGEPAVMNISQLVPMGIAVTMDRTLANKITPSTPITIYPDPSISKEPWGIARGWSILTPTGITFLVGNIEVAKTIKSDGKSLPIVTYASPILPFSYEDANTLSIESICIFKDDKGTFVWQAVGQRDMTSKGFDKSFPVKKVYVELPGPVTCDMTFTEYYAIKSNPNLNLYDTVIGDVPEGIKDGDLVTFQDPRFIFMPGDNVRVVIGPEPSN
ncbi:MAG TPA: hypothetical protein DD381_07765 [Lentisphaeria bacterium]|nr:MAG: hypothetical protein A2X47_04330 [Lentisphaerae bacterium GWF2_38_69]HBM16218.1 hypothetical protein [Lentisphaeria bacterium]